MTSPLPTPDGLPVPGTSSPDAPEFEVTVSDVIEGAVGHVIDAIHEMTESPLDIAREHMEEVGELQMQSVEALMNNDPDTAQALLAQADQEMREATEALHPTDQQHSMD